MTVTVYNTPTAPEHMTKDITQQIGSYTVGGVRDAVGVESPVITVNATITAGNYAYVPDFGRYYYIRSKNVIRKDLTELQLDVDVLMSYAAQIRTLPIIASRSAQRATDTQSAGWNAYLSDPQQPVIVPTKEDVYMIGEMSWGSLILLTVG